MQERLARIIESAMDGVISIDAEQRIVLFNPSAEKIFQVKAADVIGHSLDRFIPERFRVAHRGQVRKFGDTGVSSRQMGIVSRVMALRSNGEEFPIEASISHATFNGEMLFTVILRDVTERERAEARIREQAELLNKVTNAILVLDAGERIAFWNEGAERLYGWSPAEAVGRTPGELFRSDVLAATDGAEAELHASGEWTGQLREITKAGQPIAVESHWTLLRDEFGQPRGKIIINIDITEQNELEARFLRTQRLESVGTLVSGIAHDLNNVLTPILMAIRLLKKNKPGIDREALLDTAGASVERGTAMIRQLLDFAGGPEGERTTINLEPVIREVGGILGHTLPKTIEFYTEIPGDLWPIIGNPTQLSQVLMNLCVNARDAMPIGGTIRIAAINKHMNGNLASLYPEGKPGPYVMLYVNDTGTGIPPGVIERIFDPFYTTKPFGIGSGLGLSTVRGIVKSHGGFINVYSESGHGTTFSVYLPASFDPATVTGEIVPEEDWQGHGEIILIVDDEPFILLTAKATLESNGYKVLTANDGLVAVEMFRNKHEEIAAVLLDMMMPVLDGPATMKAMKAIAPNVKIVAASGLRLAERPAAALAAGAIGFLKKPYSDSELLKMLAEFIQHS